MTSWFSSKGPDPGLQGDAPEEAKDTLKALKEVADEIQKLKMPSGKRDAPGRTCREIALADPSRKNGYYWVDPNGGGISDSIRVFCKMAAEDTETCLESTQHIYENKEWKSSKTDADGRMWFAESFIEKQQFDYASHKSQVKFLQHLTSFARQRLVVKCKNKIVIFNKQERNYAQSIALTSFDEETMTVHAKKAFRYRVLRDECQEKKGEWGEAVLEVRGKQTRAQRIPILDVGFLDTEDGGEFGLKIGRACFR